MSRKDYIKLAKVINRRYLNARDNHRHQAALEIGALASDLCEVLFDDNPRFDKGKFLAMATRRSV